MGAGLKCKMHSCIEYAHLISTRRLIALHIFCVNVNMLFVDISTDVYLLFTVLPIVHICIDICLCTHMRLHICKCIKSCVHLHVQCVYLPMCFARADDLGIAGSSAPPQFVPATHRWTSPGMPFGFWKCLPQEDICHWEASPAIDALTQLRNGCCLWLIYGKGQPLYGKDGCWDFDLFFPSIWLTR